MAYTYQQLAPEYQQLWDTMKIIRDAAELNRVATKIQLHKAVYERVEKRTRDFQVAPGARLIVDHNP